MPEILDMSFQMGKRNDGTTIQKIVLLIYQYQGPIKNQILILRFSFIFS